MPSTLSTLTLARIWRKHWMNCPTHCSADTPAANCTCTCTHLDTIIEEGHHEEHKMIVNMYPSVAKSPDFLTASDGTDKIQRLSDAHEITGLVVRQERFAAVQCLEHQLLSFAHGQPADGDGLTCELRHRTRCPIRKR